MTGLTCIISVPPGLVDIPGSMHKLLFFIRSEKNRWLLSKDLKINRPKVAMRPVNIFKALALSTTVMSLDCLDFTEIDRDPPI